jgi:hypothetical protein
MEVREEEVVVDIPERISFELDLAIVNRSESNPSIRNADGGLDKLHADSETYTPYAASGGVFGADVVRGFARSLRTIRLLVSARAELIEEAGKLDLPPLV